MKNSNIYLTLFSSQLALLLIFAGYNANAQNIPATHLTSLEALKHSFQKKEYSLFKPYMSDNFKAGSYSGALLDQVLPQVLNQYPKMTSLEVVSFKDQVADVKFTFEMMGTETSKVFFEEDGKIIQLEFLDKILGMSQQVASTEEIESSSDFTAPFELEGGLIFVKAEVNGEEAYFILDSGSPILLLNSAHFSDMDSLDAVAGGVGGAAGLQSIHVNSFNWKGIKLTDTDLTGMDLSHLEAEVGRKIVGLIGHNVLKEYEVLIDYEKKEMHLFKGQESKWHVQVKPRLSIPFTYQAHIPVINMKVGGEDYAFGIDTGAESNLLAIDRFKEMDEDLYVEKGKETLKGADKNNVTVGVYELKKGKVNGSKFQNMEFVASDISHLTMGYGLKIDGLVGYPFLSQKKMSIDFKNEKVHIW